MKVYRLYSGGSDTITGWYGAAQTPYNETAISTIVDPNGAVSTREITSIPSPFARIDLVKAAFDEVNREFAKLKRNGENPAAALDGQTIYNKMVSDALDVGEIFFNLDKFQGKIEVIVWNPARLTQMKDATDTGQRCYADALSTYWQADAATYNFGRVQNIYILNYKDPAAPATMNIIGATSPATLFFCNSNDLSYVSGIQFGTDIPFDSIYQPLYKRDPRYIEFLWWFRASRPNFARDFPEVEQYLQSTYAAITDINIKARLNNVSAAAPPAGLALTTISTGTQTNTVEVLGTPLYHKVLQPVACSDFNIRSSKQPASNCLVLPTEAGNTYADWLYTTDKWGTEAHAPYSDSAPIAERRLPYDNTPQPYLTISDFLEDTILSSPCELNTQLFFDGHDDHGNGIYTDNKRCYLLPVKPLFFEYFTVDELTQMLQLRRGTAGSIEAVLKIPTKRGIVTYSRSYYEADADTEHNTGHIVDGYLDDESELLISPALKIPDGVQAHYTVSSVMPYTWRISLAFFKDGKEVQPENAAQTRNQNKRELPKATVYTLRNDFDCIQLRTPNGGVSIVVPTLPTKGQEKAIAVSVDLGTSNTHIELMADGNTRSIVPFEYSEADGMQGLLFFPRKRSINGIISEAGLEQTLQIIARDLMPRELSSASTYHFPSRTALSFAYDIDWNAPAAPLERSNACLAYGKLEPLPYNRYDTNVKWGNSPDADKHVGCYIENLLLLLRNRVLAMGGDLSRTTLTWFYPMSMTTMQRNAFRVQWETLYHKLFGEAAQISDLSESLAPVCFHLNNNASANDMVTIDIGGGTTDIAFAENKHVKCVTSFRFAANTLFEDSLAITRSDNGIVDYFEPEYRQLFESNSQPVALIESVKNGTGSVSTGSTSANLANLFFTINDVPSVKASRVLPSSLDFVTLLRSDGYFKIEFIVFYAAIIFHTGRIIAAKHLRLPQHVAFSGNGSNVVKVLATADAAGRRELEKFTKVLIEAASGQKYAEGDKLTILGFDKDSTPKTATCKGGLLFTFSPDAHDEEDPEPVILSHGTSTFIPTDTYDSVGDSHNAATLQEIANFFKMLRTISETSYDFIDKFGMERDSWTIINDILKQNTVLINFLNNGIAARRGKDGEQRVAETFFFYPIAAILQQYSMVRYAQLTENVS